MTRKKYDFAGWATRYNLKCSDGRTISAGAFAHCDGAIIPLVWNHTYDSPENIIGKATLIHKQDGVYAQCEFNETSTAQTAKALVKHGDITSLSIYANKLKQNGPIVLHGNIKEVSLVLAGANPGASIQEVLIHGEEVATAATIYNDDEEFEFYHDDEVNNEKEEQEVVEDEEDNAENEEKESEEKAEESADESGEIEHSAKGKTIADVYATFTEEQKLAVAAIIDQLGQDEIQNEGDSNMKHNVFDNDKQEQTLQHSIDFNEIKNDAKRCGSLKAAIMAHAEDYGIKDIESLFPEVRDIYNRPEFIKRDTNWVQPFMSALHKSPFSRLRAVYADITAEQARAKGYTKGKKKLEEVFSLLRRVTEPCTIYKKQKLDRDDIIDITSFDVVAWIKEEMRMMLNEEIARAVLCGDGRNALAEDKINEKCIRPIYNDDDLYCIKAAVTNGAENPAKDFITTCIKARIDYEGANPTLYTTEEVLCDLLLIEDVNGRFIYESKASLCNVLRVKDIVCVPVMKGLTRDAKDGKTHNVKAIIVNPNDYTLGADKGGKVATFDDFDIDYNQYKYLIETRLSGSLLKPKTAITIEEVK